MINAIDKRTRSTLGLAALACLLITIWFPSVLSDNLQQVEMSELLSGLVGSAVLLFGLSAAGVLKPIRGMEGLPLLVVLVFGWIFTFVASGAFKITPGEWREIYPSDWLWWAPLALATYIVAFILSSLTLIAPTVDPKERLLFRALLLGRKSNLKKRRLLGYAVGAVLLFTVMDTWASTSTVAAANDCVESKFQTEWRAAYLKEPWMIHENWRKPTGITPLGWEEWITYEWEVTPAVPYIPPESWTGFVNEVSVVGVKVTIVEDLESGLSRTAYLRPSRASTFNVGVGGFDFSSYVEELSVNCLRTIGPPLFPVNFNAVWGAKDLKDEISEINGFIEPKRSD